MPGCATRPSPRPGFVGAALGLAITGYRPIVEIMFADFLGVCFDQIVNGIAKHRFMSGGQFAVPVTIRAIGGAGLRFGAAAFDHGGILVHVGAGAEDRLPVEPGRGLWHAEIGDPRRRSGAGAGA